MADTIKISTQVLIDTAGKIRSINDSMDEKLEQINKEMINLESTWKSDAATEIREAMRALRAAKFEDYKAVVESYAKFLDQTAQSYESTETSVLANASEFK